MILLIFKLYFFRHLIINQINPCFNKEMYLENKLKTVFKENFNFKLLFFLLLNKYIHFKKSWPSFLLNKNNCFLLFNAQFLFKCFLLILQNKQFVWILTLTYWIYILQALCCYFPFFILPLIISVALLLTICVSFK